MNMNTQTKDFPDTFWTYIEISSGGSEKYEFDEELQGVKLDRLLFTSMRYPANYGFAMGTLGKDGDALDVLVYSAPIANGVAVKCKPIGVLEMTDEEGPDSKIIAVPIEKIDPAAQSVNDINDLPQYAKDKLKHFFEHMKELEKGKFVRVDGFSDKNKAMALLKESREAKAKE